MDLLKGKTAVVTGAARGIGRAIAVRFAQEGADVAITDLAVDENARETVSTIESYGVKAKAFASDASDYAGTEEVVKQIIGEFGKIDILVNNAGITRDTLLMRMTEEQWDLVIKVNLKSVFNFTKAVQPYMLKQRSGSIISMSSVVGVSGNAGQANYSASKAGIIGFTKSVAKEVGSRGIRCNAIAPGFIDTEMTKKLPEDVRKAWTQQIPLRRLTFSVLIRAPCGLHLDCWVCCCFISPGDCGKSIVPSPKLRQHHHLGAVRGVPFVGCVDFERFVVGPHRTGAERGGQFVCNGNLRHAPTLARILNEGKSPEGGRPRR